MPKLGHPKITKGQAISCLVQLYRNDKEFVDELDEIRLPNIPAIYDLAMSIMDFWKSCKDVLPKEDYLHIVESLLQQKQDKINLPTELQHRFDNMRASFSKLEQYLVELQELAFKWKLRIPSTAYVLLLYDIFDIYSIIGMPDEVDIPLESLSNIYPWAPPLPDLVIRVPAWPFFLNGREQIAKDISTKLLNYEKKLKSFGYLEHPSSLETHARWWYLKYIKGKNYNEIVGMETKISGGKPTVYPINVGVAVRKFSKLIGIANPKALK